MKIHIDETEVRQAVCEWLKKRNVTAKPADLIPLTTVAGEYDYQVETQIGYSIDIGDSACFGKN